MYKRLISASALFLIIVILLLYVPIFWLPVWLITGKDYSTALTKDLFKLVDL